MTTTFYGATVLLAFRPDDERLAEIAAEIAGDYLPEIESYDYRITDTVPEGVPVLEASALLSMKQVRPGSLFLLVYPASERPTNGRIPS